MAHRSSGSEDTTTTAPPRAGTAHRPAGAEVAAPRGGLQTFRSLRHREYRLLWFGTLFSSGGQWLQQVTLGWITYELTGSGFLLGAINGFRALPLLVLGPFGGVAADRVDRKRLMLATQLGLTVVTAGIATLIVSGRVELWHLFVFTLLTGVGWAFNMPVRQSVIPHLVPRADLMNAIALQSAGFNVTRILGPTVAGILIATLGAGENFYLQAAMNLAVAWLVLQMRIPAIPSATSASIGANLKEGLLFVWQHPTLRTQMSLALVPVLIALPYTALMPIFAGEVLHQGPAGFGLLMAAPGLGAVIGTLAIASLGNVARKGWLLLGSLFALGLCLMAFSLSHSFPLSLGLLLLVGATQMAFMTANQTLLQLTIPDALRGRVMGIYMLDQGLMPLGSVLAGVTADHFSAPTAVFGMGLLIALLAIGFGVQARSLREL